jgi:hypothetical protein
VDETPGRLYDEREKRVMDAIELRTPDRLPTIVRFHFFPARYAGATAEQLMYDPKKTEESYWKVVRDFEPDMIQNPFERFLGEGICLRGGVPVSLLITGTPERIMEHCRRLIKTVAKKGAFIMDASSGLDDAKPENVRALFDATREYGVY